MLLVPNIISPVMVPPAFGSALSAVVWAVVIRESKLELFPDKLHKVPL